MVYRSLVRSALIEHPSGAETNDSQLKMLNEWLKLYTVASLVVSDLRKSQKVPEDYEGVFAAELFSQAALRILPRRVEKRVEMVTRGMSP